MSIDFLINSDSGMGYTGSDTDDNLAILWALVDERVLGEQGMVVPANYSRVGVDNSYMAEIIYPRLTTVAQPIKTITRKAFSLWSEALRGEACLGLHRLKTRLGVLDSTAPPGGGRCEGAGRPRSGEDR